MTPNEARREAVKAIQEVIRHKRWIYEATGWTHPEEIEGWRNEVAFQVGLASFYLRKAALAQQAMRRAA